MITYVKKNGTEVQINEQPGNIKAAKALGWKELGAKPKEDKPEIKKAAPKKAK